MTIFKGIAIFGLLCQLSYSSNIQENFPRGHLQPLGSHREPEAVPEFTRDNYPTPEEFWNNFVKPSKPAVFRGGAKDWLGFTKWTDEYLVKNYGDSELRLEGRKEKYGRTPYGVLGVGRDTMENFVKHYHDPDHKGYVVTELPVKMYHEAGVLPFMTCGSFSYNLVEVDYWMNGGNASSVLHKDAFNTMNCLLNGTKEWKLIELKHEKSVYKAWEAAPSYGGYSKINVHSVDLLKYPKVANVPWQYTKIEKGDCLFLPKSMYHNVLSSGTNNVAVALLFSRFDGYKKRGLDFSNCDNVTKDSRPLSDFIVDWMYPGKGDLSMGNADLEVLRNEMITSLSGKDVYSLEKLTKAVHKVYSEKDYKFAEDHAKNAYKVLTDGKGVLTREMILKMPKEKLRVAAMCFERVDPSNAPWNEYNQIDPETIKETLLRHLKKNKGSLSREVFLDVYVNGLEGSPVFGNRFFDILAGEAKDVVSQDEAKQKLGLALQKYYDHQVEGEEAASPDIYRNAKRPDGYDEGDVDTIASEDERERKRRYLDDNEENENEIDGDEADPDDQDGEEADPDEQDGENPDDSDEERSNQGKSSNRENRDEL